MKKILIYVIPLLFNLPILVNAQQQGGGKANMAFSNSIIETKTGGFTLTGKTYSAGGDVEDVYVVTLDEKGNVLWTKTIAGKHDQSGNVIIQTKDGGYVLTGQAYSTDWSGEDVYVVKLDAQGNITWTKAIGGSDDEFGYSITQTNDDGYIITGAISSKEGEGENIYIVKLDASGNTVWNKTITGKPFAHGAAIVQNKDGSYTIGGYKAATADAHNKADHFDFYITKIDSTGNTIWDKTIGGAGSKSNYSMIQTSDGGYAITGAIDSSVVSNEDVYVVKLDGEGTVQWTKTVGGNQKDIGTAIIQNKDGGYAIAGATKSSGAGSFDVYVITLDEKGNVVWTKTIGGEGDDEGESIVQTQDGGYAIGGFTNAYKTSDYNFYAIKLDAQGNVLWTKAIGKEGH